MRITVRQLTICILALGLLAQVAFAQSPAERHALEQALATGEPAHQAAPVNQALAQLHCGLELFRSAPAADGRGALDAAQAAFDEAIYRAPKDWPWPWYGLALVDLALDSASYPVKASMHQGDGVYYRDAAIHALGMALAADSSFAPAARLLAERLTSVADPAVSGDVVRAIRRSVSAGSAAGPEPWLVFARLQRSLDHPDTALTAFRTYLTAGGDTAVAWLEISRSSLAAGDTQAAVPLYLRGAQVATTTMGRAEYRRDLAWIASPRELAALDSLPADSVGAWIQGFWSKRDAEEIRAPGARLTEQIRRWVYVHANFMAPQLNSRVARALRMPFADRSNLPPNMAVALGTSDFQSSGAADGFPLNTAELLQQSYLSTASGGATFLDDRALVYMRHGEPSRIVQSPGQPGGASPLSWAYATPQGQLVVHFKCALYCLLVRFPVSLDGLIGIDASYEVLAGQLRAGHTTPGVVGRVLSSIDHDLRVGLSTDGFPPQFKKQISPDAQFYAVGAPGAMLAVFALPGDKLQAQSLPDGSAGYPITLRVIATNAAGQVVRVDTTRRFRAPHALGKGEYLFGLEQLPVPAGLWNVRLLVAEPGTNAGGAIGRNGVVVPGDASLGLSDLVLGRMDSGLIWQSPSGAVSLNPLDAFPDKGSAELYYELHGARPGTTYRTDITITAVWGDVKGTVQLGFTERAAYTLVPVRRTLGLAKLTPGQYRLMVTVTEAGTGRTATQSRLLDVAGPRLSPG